MDNTGTSFKFDTETWQHRQEREAKIREQELAAWKESKRRKVRIPERYREAATDRKEVKAWSERMTIGLLLTGNVGAGKTYDACAVLNEHLDGAKFITMSGIMDMVRGGITSNTGVAPVIDRMSEYDLLVIDDLGKERPTEWTMEVLFRIIDNRMNGNRPTIITTNYSGRGLCDRLTVGDDPTMAKALISRLSMYTIVKYDGADRRLGGADD